MQFLLLVRIQNADIQYMCVGSQLIACNSNNIFIVLLVSSGILDIFSLKIK
jgi:hypothetical protein